APAGYGFMQQCFGDDARTLAQLEYIGLLFRNDRGGYGDRFRGRLMFPIKDRRGKVVGFGGRILGEGEPKYLNSPETPYFRKSELLYGLSEHREHIRKHKQLIVVEGYMDVLALAAHDLPLALAPLGTAIGERQIQQILRLHDAPVFCFDGDRAGRQASWRALERMMPVLAAEHSPRFLYLPEGEDPDSLLAKEGGEAFAARLESEAKPVLETWLTGLKLMAGKGAEGRARMAKKADTMLAQMRDDYLRQAWRQEAEQATGIRLQQQNRLRRAGVARALSSGLNTIEEKFLVGLIQKPSRLKKLPAEAREFFLDDEGVNRIYTRALSMMAEAKEDQDIQIARRLMREFPDDPRIPRWVNQETVQDREFESLLLDMQSNYIRRCQRMGGYSLEESVQFQLRLEELKKKQIEMKEAIDNTGAQ
ncbi:MAG: toprim domain-containing protein, partial [Mariprofundaceae bacterium]|nr:toprim domain-containing protein [Mariprofundaceae bacterium]